MRTGTAVPETTVYVSGLSVRYVRLWLPGDIVQEDGWVEKPAISFKGDMQMRTGRSACRADVCDNLAGNDTASDPYVRFPDKMTITDSETPVPQFYIISWTLVISYMGNFAGEHCIYGSAGFCWYVKSGVILGCPLAEWIASFPKTWWNTQIPFKRWVAPFQWCTFACNNVNGIVAHGIIFQSRISFRLTIPDTADRWRPDCVELCWHYKSRSDEWQNKQ